MSEPSSNPFESPTATGEAVYTGGVDPSTRTVEMLRQTRPWVLFLGILGVIGLALMALGAFFMIIGSLAGQGQADVPFRFMAVMYGLMVAIYAYPVICLMRYASRIKTFVVTGATRDLDDALDAQRRFWKFLGIMVIIGFVLNLVMTFGMVGMVAAESGFQP